MTSSKTTPAKDSRRDPHAALPRLDRHQPRCGEVRPSRMGRRRTAVLIAVHVVIGLHIWHWLATGRSLTPVEPSEAMQAFELGLVNAGFLLFAGLIVSTLLLGRWFCGWACHVVALQDLCAWLLARVGLRPRPVRSRLLVLAPWVVAGHMFVWPLVEHWWSPASKPLPPLADWQLQLTTDDLWRTFPGPVMAAATLFVVGFLIVFWLGAKGFCTYGCPYGAVFASADRLAPVRIVVTDACDGCGHCTHVCTSNVRVHEEVARHGRIVDPGCMKCLDCVSVCPKEALHVGFAAPKPLQISQQRRWARADFTWAEEVLLGAVALLAAQWAFRGLWLGEGVPLLLAVGLGVITAVAALLLVRLLRRRDLMFQHYTLKSAGRLTPGGRWLVLALVAWLGLTAHAFVAQRQKAAAIDAGAAPLRERLAGGRDVDPARFAAAHTAADRAFRWQLAADPELLQLRGLLRRELGRHDDAELDLRAALKRLPDLEHAATALAIYRLRAGDRTEALRLATAVATRHPDNATAQALLRALAAEGSDTPR